MKTVSEIENRIFNGDCVAVLKEMPANSIDLIVTSPPYNIGIRYDSWDDRIPWDDYFDWCEVWLKECLRVLKPDGRMALNHFFSLGSGVAGVKVGLLPGNSQVDDAQGLQNGCRVAPLMELFNIAVHKLGFKHHAIVTWLDITIAKKTAWGSWLSSSSPYINSCFEGIMLLYKDRWKKDNPGVSDISKRDFVDLTRGVWKIKTETRGLTKANFSLDFANKCIKLLSYQDALVLDPFMGSGTVAVSCVNSKRKYVGIEISPEYHRIAEDRIQAVVSQGTLWERGEVSEIKEEEPDGEEYTCL